MTRKEHKRDLAGSLPLFWAPKAVFVPLQTTSFGPNAEKFDGPALRVKAQAWAENNFALATGDSIKITNANFDARNGLYHCSMVKVSQGLEIVNSFAQITMSDDGQVISQGNSWVKTDNRASLMKRGDGVSCVAGLTTYANSMKLSVDAAAWTTTVEAGKTVIGNVDWAMSDISCVEKLYQTSNDIRHVLDLIIPRASQYLNVMVDKETGAILGASDWSSNFRVTPSGRLAKRQTGQDFKYRVLQLGAIDPKTVKPGLIVNPADLNSSPQGWHTGGTSETIGNNVIATQNLAGDTRASTIANNGKQAKAAGFNFDFAFDDTKQQPPSYTDASIVNMFFVTNRFHDIMYQYGFDEASGNFQKDNFGKGGLGNDQVLAITQDSEGFNNANFASPPDGIPGVMKMFVFDRSQPNRDGSLENAIVVRFIINISYMNWHTDLLTD
jgi:extracellular elastinolytic metalloproteinase